MERFEHAYSSYTAQWMESVPILKLKKVVKKLQGRPLVLYGAGRLAGVYLEACRNLEVLVSCICDRSVQGRYENIPIITPQELKDDFANAIVIVCSHVHNQEICNILKELGFSDSQIVPCLSRYPYFESPSSFSRHLEEYRWAYQFFQDIRSKELVLDRMALCLLDKALVPNTASECYYEEDMILLSEQEVFVDGGAFVGDSVEQFIEFTNGNYKKVYSFEPDPNNYQITVSRLERFSNIEIVKKGLYSCNTTFSFSHDNENPGGSRLETKAQQFSTDIIEVASLDVFFTGESKSNLPTFIKMDIEGSEKEALLGAADIIRRNKPKLAICAYHKAEDIYEIPKTIMSIRNDYKFVLRQHEYDGYDTVLYAV